MAILVGVVLALFSLAIVVYPLVVARSRSREVPVGEDLFQDDLELESIRDSIQTLRLDRDLGKISGEQYQQLLQSYRLAGANALKRRVEAGLGAKEVELELEILEARVALGADDRKPGSDGLGTNDDQPDP